MRFTPSLLFHLHFSIELASKIKKILKGKISFISFRSVHNIFLMPMLILLVELDFPCPRSQRTILGGAPTLRLQVQQMINIYFLPCIFSTGIAYNIKIYIQYLNFIYISFGWYFSKYTLSCLKILILLSINNNS